VTKESTHLDAPMSPEALYDVATLFALLSATARLHIVWLLTSGEQDVGTLAEATGHSVATVSQHLGKLKLGGVVRSRRDGRRQVYLLDDPRVTQLVELAFRGRLAVEDSEQPKRRRRQA
jgi:DNA-binding transcriptional ArsR family regulator